MRITITNAYTWYNKGDAGILLATIDILKELFVGCQIDILSFTPEEDSKRYCKIEGVNNVYSNILNPHPYKHTKFGKICAIFKLFFSMLKTQFIINFKHKNFKNKSLASLETSDVIVVCGGGFLGGKKLDSLMHIYQIYINTLFKKPVYIIGTSIEPMQNKLIKRLTDKVLKKVDYVYAREIITDKYLNTILPKEKHCLIPDVAFYLKNIKSNKKYMEEYKKKFPLLLGITVRKWNFPQKSNKEKAMYEYINAIDIMMEYMIEKYHCAFVFIPQVIVEHGNDADVAELIKDRLKEKYKNNFIIKYDDWSPYEIKEVIGELDGFIGTRMHSNIFATSNYVPTVAIAYEKKTNGIMHTLELDEYVMEINDIDSNILINKIELMIKNRKKITKHLKIKIEEIRNDIYNKSKEHIKGV